MQVRPVQIEWHAGLPVFAKETFLRAVGEEYGWLGGFAEDGTLRCVLPYTIFRKAFFRMARFRVETMPMAQDLGLTEEREFLNAVVEFLRSRGVDLVIPAATTALFRTYPDRAEAAPYGSYVIDLGPSEEILWKNIDRITRQNIRAASKAGVLIREASLEEQDAAFLMIKRTFGRSKLPFMDRKSFAAFLSGLGENGKLLIADQGGIAQSYCVFGYSDHAVYAIYAGNPAQTPQGANKLLYWEAMRLFKSLGAHTFDFVGARINPDKGSKQEALGLFKKRFGARLRQGYIWKHSIRPWKYALYRLAARLRSGGDIVDAEKHKMKDPERPDEG
jgi:hypothetical protein